MSGLSLWFLFVFVPNLNALSSSPVWVIVSLSLIGGLIGTVGSCIDRDTNKEITLIANNTLKFGLTSACLLIFLGVVTPNERQIYTMVGGYVVTNNEAIKKLPTSLATTADKFLEKLNRFADEDIEEEKSSKTEK